MAWRRQRRSRSTRAELQFSVSRVDRYLREGNYCRRLSASTPVLLAGILEYLTSNILMLAAEEAFIRGKKRITPEHLCWVIQNNRQLSQLFKENTKSLDDLP
ncbi:histone H2A-Bbd type 1-like [Peromyscus maniculatus bairdii]|uniref:histone H2A-Bbd type 1-like n=1 Tax=Peromyscus maniculatus bairdii TaxID=230844 RepID=UPI00042AB7D1|nr:histone H2A-Bbd type 1-like [Peromyscus maniculatus bairdii]